MNDVNVYFMQSAAEVAVGRRWLLQACAAHVNSRADGSQPVLGLFRDVETRLGRKGLSFFS